MSNYKPYPIGFTHGNGAWLYDESGHKYLDALSGIAVCGLGHANPAIADSIHDQASQLIHTSNLYQIPLQEKLAGKLCSLSNMEKVFFCNSGAEANEAAIKLTRLHGHQLGYAQPKVIVMQGSFHGRTMATLTATGNPKVKLGFEPLVEGFIHVPYNNINEVEQLVDKEQQIAAIMLEPVQGEGGIVVPDAGYLKAIREICDEQNWLMILDEVQSGMCRTGKWFAYQHESITPDVMTLAKALGNGMPIGACLAKGTAASLFQPGSHGSTFGGNPLASRVAITVIDELEKINAVQRATELGNMMLSAFKQALSNVTGVKDLRGKGLMIGIELDRPCGELVNMALDNRCLINVTAERVIRLLPPIIISDDEANQIVKIVSDIVKSFLTGSES